jgi:hypothetical protein
VTVSGCHDNTSATVELTAEQAEALFSTANALNDAAEYGCQPRILVAAEPPLTVDI